MWGGGWGEVQNENVKNMMRKRKNVEHIRKTIIKRVYFLYSK
jgi:hypothetical protein